MASGLSTADFHMARTNTATGNRAGSDIALTVGVEGLLVAGSDAAFRDFVADLFAAASGMQSVRRALGKATGLSGSEIAMLLAIRRLSAEGQVSVRAIAEHLHVAAPHATTEVGKLAEAGLVAKTTNPNDSRAVDVTLTAEGRRRLRRLMPLVRRANDVLFDGMTPDEMRHVHRFLERLIAQSTRATERIATSTRGA
jgi:DNA-binding MarR family transcriptional regulator